MTTPTVALGALAALLALAPLAAAEWYEGKPDCPPDQYCTMSGDGEPGQAEPASPTGEDPEPCDDCPKSPANNTCDADACSHNPDAPVSNTCMDGSAPSEDCDDDVQYIGGPGSGANDGREPALEESSGSAKAVPAAAGGLAIGGALVGAVVLALRRR